MAANVSRVASSEEIYTTKVLPLLEWILPKMALSNYGTD